LETGGRGYVSTRDPRFLQPWRKALHELPPVAARMRALEHEQADGHDELTARLVRLGNDYVRWTHPIVGLARNDPAGARARIETGGGKRRVDRIRRDIDRLLSGDGQTLIRTRRSVDAAERDGVIVGAAGIGGALVLFLAV